MEARQYGPALAFSILASALAVTPQQRPTTVKVFLYTAALTLGIYTNPYVAFIGIVHATVGALIGKKEAHRRRRFSFFPGICTRAHCGGKRSKPKATHLPCPEAPR